MSLERLVDLLTDRCMRMEAERDTLAAKLKEAEAREGMLRSALVAAMTECRYWLRRYRDRDGYMSEEALKEKASLESVIAKAEKSLEHCMLIGFSAQTLEGSDHSD